jgi:hypothetical protein
MIELRQDQTVSFSWYDGGGLVPASVTAQLIDRKGGVLATGVVTLPTASTTVHGQHATYFDVLSSTGITSGTHLAITSETVTYVREVLKVTANAHPRIYLRTDIPESLSSGDAVEGLDVGVSFAAVSADFGDGYQIKIVATDASGKQVTAYLGASVVRWSWQRCSAEDVADVLAAVYQDERSHVFCASVAERVNAKIEHALDSTGRRPWLYSGASNLFSEVIQAGIRYVLADHGIAPTGDLVNLLREMRFAFDDSLRVIVAGLREYDDNNDGETVQDQARLISVMTVR